MPACRCTFAVGGGPVHEQPIQRNDLHNGAVVDRFLVFRHTQGFVVPAVACDCPGVPENLGVYRPEEHEMLKDLVQPQMDLTLTETGQEQLLELVRCGKSQVVVRSILLIFHDHGEPFRAAHNGLIRPVHPRIHDVRGRQDNVRLPALLARRRTFFQPDPVL